MCPQIQRRLENVTTRPSILRRVQWQWANGSCPFALLAKQFPRRHLLQQGSFLFGEFVSHPPSGPAVPAATERLSSLLRSLKATRSALCEHHQPWFPLLLTSLTELQAAPSSSISLQAVPAFSRGHFIYSALTVWQYILCCSHLQPADTPLTALLHINKVILMISNLPPHFFNEGLETVHIITRPCPPRLFKVYRYTHY